MSITITGTVRSLESQNLVCTWAGGHVTNVLWCVRIGRVDLMLCPLHIGQYVEPTREGIVEFIQQLVADRTTKVFGDDLVNVTASLLEAGGFDDLHSDLIKAWVAISDRTASSAVRIGQARMLISSVVFELIAPTVEPVAADQDDDACEAGR